MKEETILMLHLHKLVFFTSSITQHSGMTIFSKKIGGRGINEGHHTFKKIHTLKILRMKKIRWTDLR